MLPANEWYLSFGAAALQADGKIVVAIDASGTGFSNTNWELLRFNANGSLDTTFGGSGTGKVITSFPGGYAIPQAIAIQPTDGKIVVVGTAGNATAVARYTTRGTLDTSFGTGGEVITPIGGSATSSAAVTIDSLGRIIVGGSMQGNNALPALARYNPNGTLDTSFGLGGVQTMSLPPSFVSADTTGLGLQSTGSDVGKIVVSMSGGNNGLALTRLNSDGSLDGSFGSGGFYVESRMNGGLVAIQPDDKLIMAGRPNNTVDPYEYVVTRVLADGSSYDPSFGSAGLGQTNFGTQPEAEEMAAALAPDGKIVVAGSYGSNPEKFATVRFLGDSTSNTTAVAATTAPLPVTAGGPDPILGVLVFNDPTFLDSLASAKHRRQS
jgi:uncharacterized delta-60 repeat protein